MNIVFLGVSRRLLLPFRSFLASLCPWDLPCPFSRILQGKKDFCSSSSSSSRGRGIFACLCLFLPYAFFVSLLLRSLSLPRCVICLLPFIFCLFLIVSLSVSFPSSSVSSSISRILDASCAFSSLCLFFISLVRELTPPQSVRLSRSPSTAAAAAADGHQQLPAAVATAAAAAAEKQEQQQEQQQGRGIGFEMQRSLLRGRAPCVAVRVSILLSPFVSCLFTLSSSLFYSRSVSSLNVCLLVSLTAADILLSLATSISVSLSVSVSSCRMHPWMSLSLFLCLLLAFRHASDPSFTRHRISVALHDEVSLYLLVALLSP